MSTQDLDVARESVHAFSRRDFASQLAMYAPDAVVYSPEGWPESGPFVGREAVMRQFMRASEDWEDQEMETGREGVHGDWVLIELVWRARGRASGADLEMRLSGAFLMRDHLIAELHLFWNYQDALAKAGIGA